MKTLGRKKGCHGKQCSIYVRAKGAQQSWAEGPDPDRTAHLTGQRRSNPPEVRCIRPARNPGVMMASRSKGPALVGSGIGVQTVPGRYIVSDVSGPLIARPDDHSHSQNENEIRCLSVRRDPNTAP